MDFLYLQRGLESKPCREISYIIRCTHVGYCVCCFVSFVYVNPLLITSTFTRVQIQSNLGTTVAVHDMYMHSFVVSYELMTMNIIKNSQIRWNP